MIFLKKYIFLLIFLLYPFSVFAFSSKSTIVMDVDSGRVLYEENAHEKSLIASITKIMTCIVTIENSRLDSLVEIGDEILGSYGTSIYVKQGEILSIEDLLYGLMLRSGNDAALVLATHVFHNYDEFISRMNEKAISLGMKDSYFNNPHGLDDDTQNISTAYDMAILSQYAFHNSIYRKIISTKKYVTKSNYKSYIWYNRMSLLNQYEKCFGGKNGYTPKAGKTLVSYASDNSLRLLIVTIDDNDIYNHHKALYNQFFNQYQQYLIVQKDKFFIDPSITKKQLYLKKSFSYPLTKQEIDDISTVVHIFKEYDTNSIAGTVEVKLRDMVIGELDIYEKKRKKKKPVGFFRNLINLFI